MRVWNRPILSCRTSRQLVWATSDCLPIGDAAVRIKMAVDALKTMWTGCLIDFFSFLALARSPFAEAWTSYKRKSRERTAVRSRLLQIRCHSAAAMSGGTVIALG